VSSDATALAQRIADGELTAHAAVTASLEAGARRAGELGCYLERLDDEAAGRADELDSARARGEPAGPLAGVHYALQAYLCLEGARASCGSRALEAWRAPYTATAVQRLLDDGAVPVAVTNMDEFGMGSSGENSAFGPARNPWDPARTPGGSSSGSAAAVAAGLVPFALGSDTGGSVRQPAAFTGVSGFKPSWGRVSRHGLVAFASSLDQVGVLAPTARDLERVYLSMAGPDPRDPTTVGTPPPPSSGEPGSADLRGLRLGVLAMPELPDGDGDGSRARLDPGVEQALEAAVEALVALGLERREVHLRHAHLALPAYYVVATAEAWSNLARYDGVRYGARADGPEDLAGALSATRGVGFGAEVKRRILLGTHVLSAGFAEAWYRRAARVRRLVAADYAAAFEQVDLLLGPTVAEPAFALGERQNDPLAMYLTDVLTVPPSLAGLPAASLPAGQSGGLPVGVQLVAPRLGDARVLTVARAFQAVTEHHLRRPPGYLACHPEARP
jgi:aspartyl-tRNA(Asn)/glutamyl-tRNA(Gln) amidotransferase subunit A